MHFFEYPYVIITSLVIAFIVMGIIALCFTLKSVKTARGSAEKSFCGIGRIEANFEKAGAARQNRCLIYISMSLDAMIRLYSESKALRMYEQVKRILLFHFGKNGNISLYGQENFVVLSYLSAEPLALLIEKCNEEIGDVFAKYGAVNVVHLHFGCHATTATDLPFKTALTRAKQACSMAEDRAELSCEWNASGSKEFERKIKIENSIENEIENNHFFLEYQPVLDAHTNRIIGAEVLARLNSPTEGILMPPFFLGAVNSVGLNQKFDYYIFEKNCKWIANDKAVRMDYVYTINFSRHTLCDEHFADTIIDIVEQYGLSYSCLAVEILEDKDLTAEEKSVTRSNLMRLREKGVLILLDDFGKGYTNFGDLKDFAINVVKIDKSITQAATDNDGFLILKNIIRTAHDLRFKTLCEGIETEEHQRLVVEAGCDILQGYRFYRPMPVTQLEELLEAQR